MLTNLLSAGKVFSSTASACLEAKVEKEGGGRERKGESE